jgi:hypothetical protein
MVQVRGNNGEFYQYRGEGVVVLAWIKNSIFPTGLFCCEIPPYQEACIGVYPPDEGIVFDSKI